MYTQLSMWTIHSPPLYWAWFNSLLHFWRPSRDLILPQASVGINQSKCRRFPHLCGCIGSHSSPSPSFTLQSDILDIQVLLSLSSFIASLSSSSRLLPSHLRGLWWLTSSQLTGRARDWTTAKWVRQSLSSVEKLFNYELKQVFNHTTPGREAA